MVLNIIILLKIFIPAARSRTTTLLRLHPSYKFYDSTKEFIYIKIKQNECIFKI